MFCIKCGKQNSENSKYCTDCGQTLEISNTKLQLGNNLTSKEKIILFLDIESKKNFFQSLVIYIIILCLGLALHMFIPLLDDSLGLEVTYGINIFFSFFACLLISYLKGYKLKSWIWALMAGLIGYLFGMYVGLLPLLYLLMTNSKQDNPINNNANKTLIYGLVTKGFIVVLVGILITYGSLILAAEGDTFTIFYGLVIWGFYLLLKALYYSIYPNAINKLLEKQIEKTDIKNDSTLKSNSHQKSKITSAGWVVLVIVGFIFLIALLTS